MYTIPPHNRTYHGFREYSLVMGEDYAGRMNFGKRPMHIKGSSAQGKMITPVVDGMGDCVPWPTDTSVSDPSIPKLCHKKNG